MPRQDPFSFGVLCGDWGDADPPPPENLRIVTWNIHFASGPRELYSRPSRKAVLAILEGISGFLKGLAPDIVFIQESDFRSARSRDVDQMRYLARKLGLRYMSPTVTWKNRYVPYPLWPIRAHYGRIHSGQAILSRFPLVSAERLRLPQPQSNPWWYNLFYLQRAVTSARVRIGGEEVALFNVHLEAFDVDNRVEHATLLLDFYRRQKGERAVMAGDFNAVPPEAAQKAGFSDEPDHDMSGDATIEIIRSAGLREGIDLESYTRDEHPHFTFPSWAPNRRLDYIWVSPGWTVIEARVLGEATGLSDHLPVLATLPLARPGA